MQNRLKKVPSGIASLDPIIKGGFPAGSFVLLLGDVGAGHEEFAYTSAIMLSLLNQKRTLQHESELIIPKKILYISLTRSETDVLNEIAFSFDSKYFDMIKNNIQFEDLSTIYFKKSPVPQSWTASQKSPPGDIRGAGFVKNLIDELVKRLDQNAANNLVIIDSLTSFARNWTESMTKDELISFLRGLQKASKQWNGLVYVLLSSKILDGQLQEEIMDCVDGTLVFEWEEMGAYQRRRTMYVKKFRGLMPHLEQDNIVKFETRISVSSGFEVSNVKQIFGRG